MKLARVIASAFSGAVAPVLPPDIISATIRPDGDSIEIVFASFSNAATYDFGLGVGTLEYWQPSANTPRLTVTSLGYTNTATLTTRQRTVYLTSQARQPFPNEASKNAVNEGINVRTVFWLSDHVYLKDKAGAGNSGTDVVLNVNAGWVNEGAKDSVGMSGITVTNNSVLPYPEPYGGWSDLDRTLVVGNTLRLKAVGACHHPQNNLPLACVRFTATDGTNTVSRIESVPVIDPTATDAIKIVEYIADVDMTGISTPSTVTCDFQLYPWIGDVVLDTAVINAPEYGATTQQIPRQRFVFDRNDTFGRACAVVDAVNGTAGGTVVANPSLFASALPFATSAQALAAISAYHNTNHGRNNPDGGTIYYRGNAIHTWSVTSASFGNVRGTNWASVILDTYPGDTKAIIQQHPTVANKFNPNFTLVRNVNLQRASGDAGRFFEVPAQNTHTINFDGTEFSELTAGANFLLRHKQPKFKKITRPLMSVAVSTGSGGNLLIRGSNLPASASMFGRGGVIIGNRVRDVDGQAVITSPLFATATLVSNDLIDTFFAFNDIHTTAPILNNFNLNLGVYPKTMCIAQNLINCTNADTPAIGLHRDSSTSTSTYGAIVYNNVSWGARWNLFYNDIGTTRIPHLGHVVKLNAVEYMANKADLFGTNNGNRTGSWGFRNGCGVAGNLVRRYQDSDISRFGLEFTGLYSKVIGYTLTPLPPDLGYVDTTFRTGNFRPSPTSPYFSSIPISAMYPFDLDGVARNTSNNGQGAYVLP